MKRKEAFKKISEYPVVEYIYKSFVTVLAKLRHFKNENVEIESLNKFHLFHKNFRL